jgi:hypothetical protein
MRKDIMAFSGLIAICIEAQAGELVVTAKALDSSKTCMERSKLCRTKLARMREHPIERYTGVGRTNALGLLPWRKNGTESA